MHIIAYISQLALETIDITQWYIAQIWFLFCTSLSKALSLLESPENAVLSVVTAISVAKK